MILVAGGEGYLGSVVCNTLSESHNVTSLDLGWFDTELNSGVTRQTKDIFQIEDLSGFDSVLFLAGLSNDPMAEFDHSGSFSQNTGSLFHLAKVAKSSGCKRFICASSCSVYGWQDKEVNELDEAITETYYGVSKYLGEKAIAKLADENFHVCIYRMGTLSGHSPRMRFDLIVNAMYRSYKQTNKVVVNDPQVWRPILDVRDAARAYQFAIESPQPISGIYNLAYDNYPVMDVANFFKDLTGCKIECLNIRENRNYRANTDKIKSLGFNFLHSPNDIIQDLLARSYSDMDSDKFFNIKMYRGLNDNK